MTEKINFLPGDHLCSPPDLNEETCKAVYATCGRFTWECSICKSLWAGVATNIRCATKDGTYATWTRHTSSSRKWKKRETSRLKALSV